MKILALIPARGGSKGIPKKNIKLLNSKPLIYYTIDAARRVFKDIDICVSTDSLEIKEIVEHTGLKVPFLRPSELASDESGTEGVIKNALNFYNNIGIVYDIVVLLQPTSPFRTSKHIKEAINLYSSNLDMVVSVKETKANPYFVLFEEEKNGFLKKSKTGTFTRRQDCPKVYQYNGSIYVMNVESILGKGILKFNRIKKYLQDDISSMDIDNELDWILSEYLIHVIKNNKNEK